MSTFERQILEGQHPSLLTAQTTQAQVNSGVVRSRLSIVNAKPKHQGDTPRISKVEETEVPQLPKPVQIIRGIPKLDHTPNVPPKQAEVDASKPLAIDTRAVICRKDSILTNEPPEMEISLERDKRIEELDRLAPQYVQLMNSLDPGFVTWFRERVRTETESQTIPKRGPRKHTVKATTSVVQQIWEGERFPYEYIPEQGFHTVTGKYSAYKRESVFVTLEYTGTAEQLYQLLNDLEYVTGFVGRQCTCLYFAEGRAHVHIYILIATDRRILNTLDMTFGKGKCSFMATKLSDFNHCVKTVANGTGWWIRKGDRFSRNHLWAAIFRGDVTIKRGKSTRTRDDGDSVEEKSTSGGAHPRSKRSLEVIEIDLKCAQAAISVIQDELKIERAIAEGIIYDFETRQLETDRDRLRSEDTNTSIEGDVSERDKRLIKEQDRKSKEWLVSKLRDLDTQISAREARKDRAVNQVKILDQRLDKALEDEEHLQEEYDAIAENEGLPIPGP